MRDLFKSLKIPNYYKPAIGGLLIGIIGMFLPQILGTGYGWAQFAIDGNYVELPVLIMIIVIFAKIIATGLTVGSGGSGGVFAPGLVIGAMVGGTLWSILSGLTAIIPLSPAAFVIVGMMTLFGGIAKAPLSIMIMVSEMTGEHSFLIPSMISVMIAFFLTGESFIYENQVNTRADSPAHRAEYSVPLLKKLRIRDAMVTGVITTNPESTVKEISTLMKNKNVDAVPILDNGRLVGIVASLDIARVPQGKWDQVTAWDIMTKKLVTGYGHELLYDAMVKMTENKIGHLLIVDGKSPDRLVGLLAYHDIAITYELPRKTGGLAD